MSTYTQILYQIIFSTKGRIPVMNKKDRTRLYGFMKAILKNKKCHLYILNGVDDHLHIVTHLHPSVSLATLVKDLKVSSNSFIKKEGIFRQWKGWQTGYSAFTYSQHAKKQLINYVKNQEHHHKKINYKEELIELLKIHGIAFNEAYLL